MTDRELLAAAAKAAGIEYWVREGGTGLIVGSGHAIRAWNPLINDGDALRLAVKLNLFAGPHFWHELSVQQAMAAMNGDRQDHYAATRRAIVRAAAALAAREATK